MFERFSERARQVVVLAQDEARMLRHPHIGTEHLLLGLLREEEGLAASVLDSFGVTVEQVRAQVARLTAHLQSDEITTGEIPFTTQAKTVLESALHEALFVGRKHIDTEHILIALVGEGNGVAARILLGLDANAEKVRGEIIRTLSDPGRPPRGTQHTQVTSEPLRGYGPQATYLVLACPDCATPIETITTDQPNASFNISAEVDRTCPGCGKQWRIAYTVSWEEQPPPGGTGRRTG